MSLAFGGAVPDTTQSALARIRGVIHPSIHHLIPGPGDFGILDVWKNIRVAAQETKSGLNKGTQLETFVLRCFNLVHLRLLWYS